MTAQEIEAKVIELAATAYGVDAATITPATNINEGLSAKSLQKVAFLSLVENELDVEIPFREAGKYPTIGDIIDRVVAEQ